MKKTFRRWNAPALLLGSVMVLATPPVPAANDVEYLAARNLARAEAMYESLVTAPRPQPSPPGRDDGKTCEQLWTERIALEGDTYHYQPPLSEDPRVWIAKAVSTVFFPAVLYVGVAAAVRLEEHTTRFRARERIDELARASAELRCFERG